MFLPKLIKFNIGNKDYSLRIEYICFKKNKILPQYEPVYYLEDSTGEAIKLDVETDANWIEFFAFTVTEIKKRLFSNIIDLLTKLYTFSS